MYDMLWQYPKYPNRYVSASYSEDLVPTVEAVPFFLEEIITKLEGGKYMGLILVTALLRLVIR